MRKAYPNYALFKKTRFWILWRYLALTERHVLYILFRNVDHPYCTFAWRQNFCPRTAIGWRITVLCIDLTIRNWWSHICREEMQGAWYSFFAFKPALSVKRYMSYLRVVEMTERRCKGGCPNGKPTMYFKCLSTDFEYIFEPNLFEKERGSNPPTLWHALASYSPTLCVKQLQFATNPLMVRFISILVWCLSHA